ncbi:MAG: hypothetical protein WAU23_11760 [Ferruginibacter sp.]
MKILLMFFFVLGFSVTNAQTKSTTLTNFSPASLGMEVITLAIPADQQTLSGKITYVRTEYGNGKFSIIGYGSDGKLSYVATNKLGVPKDAMITYASYQKNENEGSQNLVACQWCKCVKDCAIKCTTNWCNVVCLLGCIEV